MSTRSLFGLLGIGFFAFLAAASAEVLIEMPLQDLFISEGIEPLMAYSLIHLFKGLTFIWLTWYLMTSVGKKWKAGSKLRSVLIQIIALAIILNILQALYILVREGFLPHVYLQKSDIYWSELSNHYLIRTFVIEVPTVIIKYLIVAILILNKTKSLPNDE